MTDRSHARLCCLLLFLLIALQSAAVAVAFHPAIMSADSITQWGQALSGSFSDTHPYSFAVLLALFAKSTGDPFYYVLVQGLAAAGTITWVFGYFLGKGVTRWLTLAAAACLATFVPIYVLSATMWKDVPYSYAVLALSVLVYRASLQGGFSPRQWIGLGVTTWCVLSFRHNGLIYAAVVPVVMFGLFRRRRVAMPAVSLAVVLIVLILSQVIGPRLLAVDMDRTLLAQLFRSHIMAGVISHGGAMTGESRDTLLEIAPDEVWKRYECWHHYQVFWSPEFDIDRLNDHHFRRRWERSFTDLVSSNARLIAWQRVCLVYHMLFTSHGGTYSRGVAANEFGQSRVIIAPRLTEIVERILAWSRESAARYVFWAPVGPLIVIVVAAILAVRMSLPASVAFVIVHLANAVTVLAISASAEYRYLFNLPLAAFIVPLVIAAELKQRQKDQVAGPPLEV